MHMQSAVKPNDKKQQNAVAIFVLLAVILFTWWYMFSSGSPSTPAAPAASATTPVAVTANMSDADKLKALATNAIADSNKTLGNDATVRGVDVVPQEQGGYGVFVEFDAMQSTSASVMKQGIEYAMADVYDALYTSSLDVRTASVAAYLPLTDKYGNTSAGMVYKTMLDKATASKVNWSASTDTLYWQVLPGLWTTTILNPSLSS